MIEKASLITVRKEDDCGDEPQPGCSTAKPDASGNKTPRQGFRLHVPEPGEGGKVAEDGLTSR